MKRLVLAVLGFALALGFTSCEDQDKKALQQKKLVEKERVHHRRW